MDGRRAHAWVRFTWIAAPAAAGAGNLKVYSQPNPHTVVFITNHHGQILFDLNSRQFTICPHGACHA